MMLRGGRHCDGHLAGDCGARNSSSPDNVVAAESAIDEVADVDPTIMSRDDR